MAANAELRVRLWGVRNCVWRTETNETCTVNKATSLHAPAVPGSRAPKHALRGCHLNLRSASQHKRCSGALGSTSQWRLQGALCCGPVGNRGLSRADTPDLHHTTFCVHAATTKQEVVFIPPVWCSDFSCAFDAKNFNYISRLLHGMKMQLQLSFLLHFVMLLFSAMVHYCGLVMVLCIFAKGAIKEALKRLSLIFGVLEHSYYRRHTSPSGSRLC